MRVSTFIRAAAMLAAFRVVGGITTPQTAAAQGSTPLVFDGVAVIDVEHGQPILDQRVVVVGNRIQTIGPAKQVSVPSGAQVVDARGKYLIPGLWDMHVHPRRWTDYFYPLFIANGVTGIRDAGSEVPIDTLQLWRREILAGTRVGPPRQMLSGQSIAGPDASCVRASMDHSPQSCIRDSADAVHYVDSLHALKVDLIKPRDVDKAMYRAVALESKRLGIPFGGHAQGSDAAGPSDFITSMEASNLGATFVDHELGERPCWKESGDWDSTSFRSGLTQCQSDAKIYQKNNTWFVSTFGRTDVLRGSAANAVFAQFSAQVQAFWGGSLLHGNWLHDSTSAQKSRAPGSGVIGAMTMAQETDLPLISGTDAGAPVLSTLPPGFSLQAELAMTVAEGVTPLRTLQSATLNPAKALHMTDSLGTVAPGKLADMLLLDGNPLEDITNTTAIRAVVANGRYYDRAALDQLLKDVQAKAKQEGGSLGNDR